MLADNELIDWIDESAERIARCAVDAGAGRPVPSCGGWTMSDLVGHVAPLYSGWFRYNLQQPPGEGDFMAAIRSALPLPDGFGDRVEYLRRVCAEFTSFAGRVDLDEPVWAFWTTQPARFWLKRAATELAIHAWDAEAAVGEPERLDPDRAVTSIDECLRGLWPGMVEAGHRMGRRRIQFPVSPAGFCASDTGDEWLVSTSTGSLEIESSLELADDAAAGDSHDLLLYLWGRSAGGQGVLEVSGDPEVVAAWRVPRLS